MICTCSTDVWAGSSVRPELESGLVMAKPETGVRRTGSNPVQPVHRREGGAEATGCTPLHGRRWRPRVSRPPVFAGIAQWAEQPGERGHEHRIMTGSGAPERCPSHSQALRLIAVDAVPGSNPGPRVFGDVPMDDTRDVMDRLEKTMAAVDPAVQVVALRQKLEEKKNLFEQGEPVDGVCRLVYREDGDLFVKDVGLNGAPTEEILEDMHWGTVDFYRDEKDLNVVDHELLVGEEKKYSAAPIRVTEVEYDDDPIEMNEVDSDE